MRTPHTRDLTLGEYKLIGYYSLIKIVFHWVSLKKKSPLQSFQQKAKLMFQQLRWQTRSQKPKRLLPRKGTLHDLEVEGSMQQDHLLGSVVEPKLLEVNIVYQGKTKHQKAVTSQDTVNKLENSHHLVADTLKKAA